MEAQPRPTDSAVGGDSPGMQRIRKALNENQLLIEGLNLTHEQLKSFAAWLMVELDLTKDDFDSQAKTLNGYSLMERVVSLSDISPEDIAKAIPNICENPGWKLIQNASSAQRRRTARKAALGKLANDPKQIAKAKIKERWIGWQNCQLMNGERYRSAADFARKMTIEFPEITDPNTITSWISAWSKDLKNTR